MTAEGQPRKLSAQARGDDLRTNTAGACSLCTPRTMPGCAPAATRRAAVGQAPAPRGGASTRAWSRRRSARGGSGGPTRMSGSCGRGLAVIDIDPRSGWGMTPSWTCADRTARSLTPSRPSRAAAGGIYLATNTRCATARACSGQGSTCAAMVGTSSPPSTMRADVRTHAGVLVAADEVEVARARGVDRRADRATKSARAAGRQGEPFPEGQRNASLYKRACSMREAGRRDAILAAIMAENDARCVPSLDPRRSRPSSSACKHPRATHPRSREDRGARGQRAGLARGAERDGRLARGSLHDAEGRGATP